MTFFSRLLLKYKFSLVLGLCVLGSISATSFVISRFFVADQEAYLRDFQASLALHKAQQLNERFNFMHSQVSLALNDKRTDVSRVIASVKGVLGGEIWENGNLLSSFPHTSDDPLPPPDGDSKWVLSRPSSHWETPSFRWIGRFGNRVLALDFPRDWLSGIFNDTHGTSVNLVLEDGAVILSSSEETSRRNKLVLPPTGSEHGKEGSPRTRRYEAAEGEVKLGTVLPLATKPSIILLVDTPYSTISWTVEKVYLRSATVAAVFLTLAILIGFLFSSTLTEQLQNLGRLALEVAAGKERESSTAWRSVASRGDEVGILTRSFATMIDNLGTLKEALKRNERLAAMGEFSAAMVHGLKNPLTGALINIQVGRQSAAPENQEPLEAAETEIKRANAIVMDLMKFARRDEPPVQRFDLREIVRSAVAGLRPTIERMGVDLDVRISEDPLPCLAYDEQLREVIGNLVQNALQAMEKRPHPRLVVSVDQASTGARIRIADTGAGIAPEVQKRIFEPFFTTKKMGSGTGLGLAICRSILGTHRGSIQVESSLDVGTTFEISLPLVSEPDSLSTKKAA